MWQKNRIIITLIAAFFATTVGIPFDQVQAASYSSTVLSDSPLYYWQMNDASGATTAAASAGGVALNLTGATAGSTAYVGGSSISFNGTSNSAATASSLNLTAYNKIVVEALLYIPSYTTVGRVAWELGPNVSTYTDTLYFAVDGGVDGTSALSNVAVQGNVGYSLATYPRLTAANWHHVVTVYDKSLSTDEVSLYVDGSLVSVTSRVLNDNNTNTFGNRVLYLMSRAGTSLYTAGKMQHLAIYSNLSAPTIATHAATALANVVTSGTLSEASHTASTATLSWTNASGGTAPITAQLQRSAQNANSWSNVSGGTTSPSADTGLSVSTAYDYRVVYTDSASNQVISNTVTVTTDSSPATAITLTGPTTSTIGNASSNFTVGSDGLVSGTVVVTPSDSGAGGTFTPSSASISGMGTATFTYTGATTGTKSISVTNNGGLTNPSATTIRIGNSGILLGDSTVASYLAGTQIADFVYSASETSAGYSVTSIAVPGNTIAQQKTAYLATSNRATFDYTIVQVGLNDLNPAEAASVAIARLQDLIDTINSNKKTGSLVIVSTMTPAKQRLIDVYGATNGAISYQKWLDMNAAIKGEGATPITGASLRISNHTTYLNDGAGNLDAAYDLGDHIHENNAARQIIAHLWRDGLAQLGILFASTSSAPTVASAVAGNSSAVITLTEPQFTGGAAVTGYTIVASPSAGTDAQAGTTNLSHTISGLTAGVSYTFTAVATNSAGSSDPSAASGAVVPTDTTAPSTTDNASSSWSASNVTITLTCSDTYGSGCATTYYTTDGSTPTTGSSSGSSILLTESGTYTVKYFSVDGEGNTESVNTIGFLVKIDKISPASVGAPSFGTVTKNSIEITQPTTVTETGSGLHQWQVKKNGVIELGFNATTTAVSDTSLTENTQYSYAAQFKDYATNVSSYGDTASKYTKTPDPTGLSGALSTNGVTITVNGFTNDTVSLSGYYFSRTGKSSGWIQTNSWSDQEVVCETSYTYSVKYRNAEGVETDPAVINVTSANCNRISGGSSSVIIRPSDTIRPIAGYSVLINNGLEKTSNRVIPIKFLAGYDIKYVAISMVNNFESISLQNYYPQMRMDLCSKAAGAIIEPVCPDGDYVVHVKLYTSGGIGSQVISQRIKLESPPLPKLINPLVEYRPIPKVSPVFSRNLQLGVVSSDVTRLQKLLATMPDVYPEGGVTGYFGSLTKKAIQRFQLKYKIVTSKNDPGFGIVGSKTRLALKNIFK